MNQLVLLTVILAASLPGPQARADHRQDCEGAEYAKQYETQVQDTMKNHVELLKQQQSRHQKNLDTMTAALKQSGAWSKNDEGTFFKNIWTDESGKAANAAREKATERWKMQVYAMHGLGAIAKDGTAEMARAMCLLGPKLLDESVVFHDALENVWVYMETKVAAVARDKNVTLPVLP